MHTSNRKRPRRLSATFVRTVNLPGRYGDGYGGHGLSLLVKPATHGGLSKSWAQAIRPNGRTTSVGLGSYPVVTLAAAREKALHNARAVAEGRDPRRRTRSVPSFAQAFCRPGRSKSSTRRRSGSAATASCSRRPPGRWPTTR